MNPKQVVVTMKPWYQSFTIILNGVFFLLTSYVQIVQLLTDNNVLTPIVGLFVKNPQQVTPVITAVIQIATAANILLRMKTKAPITK